MIVLSRMVIAWNRHIRRRELLPGERVSWGRIMQVPAALDGDICATGFPLISGILPAIVTSGSYLVVMEVNRSLSHDILSIRLPEVLWSPCNNVHTISWIPL